VISVIKSGEEALGLADCAALICVTHARAILQKEYGIG
jgi:hypothetical protein